MKRKNMVVKLVIDQEQIVEIPRKETNLSNILFAFAAVVNHDFFVLGTVGQLAVSC